MHSSSELVVQVRQSCKPTFGDMDFCDTVDVITDVLMYTQKKEPLQDKMETIVLNSLKFLKRNSESMQRSFAVTCESWMQNHIQLSSCGQEAVSDCMSMDICVAVISRFEFEKRFMEVLLEEKEFEIIKELGESLGRWNCVYRSVIFVSRCLEVLLKTFEISSEKKQNFHSLFLTKLEMILKDLPYQQSHLILKKLKRIYVAEICRKSFSALHFDIKSLVLLKSAFELVEHDVDASLMLDHGDGRVSLLKREISRHLEGISLMEKSRVTEVFELVCKDEISISEAIKSDQERIEVFKCGFLFLESVEARFRSQIDYNLQDLKETDIDILWTQIVNLLVSKNYESFSEMASKLFGLHNLQSMIMHHNFMELLDTWDNSPLVVLENLPRITDLFSPVICSEDFLVKIFKELADFHTSAVLDAEKQETFNSLLNLVHSILKNAEFKVIEAVMRSCLDIFNRESLSFFSNSWSKEKFLKQLNQVMNQLSENDSENFHDLAHLSIISPFDTLHELISRGCSSAPLAKLVIKFLDEMTPLLLLQREKFQVKEIIIAITNNLKTIEKEKCQVMADFISNLMKIKHIGGSKTAVSAYDIISSVLIPGLEKQRVKNGNGTPLNLLLLILQSVFNSICDDGEKLHSKEFPDVILRSSFCMMQILEKYETDSPSWLSLVQNERQHLHLSILTALQTAKSFCFDPNVMTTFYETVLAALPTLKWLHKFYFVDLLHDIPYLVPFPIPSPILDYSPSYGSLQFYGVEILSSNAPCNLWILLLNICQINISIAQHFVEIVLKSFSLRLLDIVTAVSQSLLESTNNGWQSVLSLIRAICQIGSPDLFRGVSFNGIESLPNLVKYYFYENFIIIHSFLIVLDTFILEDHQTLNSLTQKIESSFIKSMQELKESDNYDAINCFVILYKFASLLQKRLYNSSQMLDSVILQLLETISTKTKGRMKPNEYDQWTQIHLDFKKYLSNISS